MEHISFSLSKNVKRETVNMHVFSDCFRGFAKTVVVMVLINLLISSETCERCTILSVNA